MIGLMWHGCDGYSLEEGGFRHTCGANGEEIRYNWLRNDGSFFGDQKIIDKPLKMTIDSIFLHQDATDNGTRSYGSELVGGEWDWNHRIAMRMKSGEANDVVLYYYIALEASQADQTDQSAFKVDDVLNFAREKRVRSHASQQIHVLNCGIRSMND
jgi:hypothetical protein